MGKRRRENWKRKGVSVVVATVIMIVLVIAAIAIVWVVVTNIVEEGIEGSEACFGIFDKVTIENGYTCYNSSSEEFQFSINLGDIQVDEILVAVSSAGSTKSFNLGSNTQESYLKNYLDESYGGTLQFPGKNAGRTYVLDMSSAGLSGSPDSLEIAPIINDEQCGVSDSVSEFDDCLLLS
jgi:hypothetical protein